MKQELLCLLPLYPEVILRKMAEIKPMCGAIASSEILLELVSGYFCLDLVSRGKTVEAMAVYGVIRLVVGLTGISYLDELNERFENKHKLK
jgi:hypothetical protein